MANQVRLNVTYQYQAYAGFHVMQWHTEGAPILLFSDPMAIPKCTPWDLCAAGNLGSMESNVMAGRALFGCLHLMVSEGVPFSLSMRRLRKGRASPLSIEPIGGLLRSR